jgi:hypothetical protein
VVQQRDDPEKNEARRQDNVALRRRGEQLLLSATGLSGSVLTSGPLLVSPAGNLWLLIGGPDSAARRVCSLPTAPTMGRPRCSSIRVMLPICSM